MWRAEEATLWLSLVSSRPLHKRNCALKVTVYVEAKNVPKGPVVVKCKALVDNTV